MMKICIVSMCFLSVLVTVSMKTSFFSSILNIFRVSREMLCNKFSIKFKIAVNPTILYNLKKNKFWYFFVHLQAKVIRNAVSSIYDFTVKDTYGQYFHWTNSREMLCSSWILRRIVASPKLNTPKWWNCVRNTTAKVNCLNKKDLSFVIYLHVFYEFSNIFP